MESYIVLAQKNVLFHGIWKAQYKVSESLMKSIGTSIPTTPSRACKLLLTSAGLSLIVLPSPDGMRGKTDQVSFDDLRGIVQNQYNPICFVIIYVDNTHKFSVMACSSDDENDIEVVCKAFRDRRNLLQHQRTRSDPQPSLNSGTLEKQRFLSDGHPTVAKENYFGISTSSAVGSGELTNCSVVSSEGYGSSQRSDSSTGSWIENGDQEDVFIDSPPEIVYELELVAREPVSHGGRRASFNIGIQTLPSEADSDSESINSSTSIQTLKDDVFALNEEMKALQAPMEKSTGVSADEYYRRSDIHGNGLSTKSSYLPASKDNRGNQDGDLPEVKNGPRTLHVVAFEEEDDNKDYDMRSVGMQTLSSNAKGIRRYAKKQVNATTSNAYKERLATLKKRSTGTAPRSSTSNDSGSAGNAPASLSASSGSTLRSHNTPTIYGSTLRPHNKSTTSGSTVRTHTPHNDQRMVTGPQFGIHRPTITNGTSVGSTVVRSIETVYHGQSTRVSLRGRGQRVFVLTTGELTRK